LFRLGLNFSQKPKRQYKKKDLPTSSRVDKLISILDEANKKDKAEHVRSKPKRKHVKKKSMFEGWF
jgi:hypothetical protein